MTSSIERRMRPRRTLAAYFLSAAATFLAGLPHAFADPLSDIDYRLGSGLRIPGTGFTLGGYATLGYDPRNSASTNEPLNRLSMFVWWEGAGRWKVFGEVEAESTLGARAGNVRNEDGHLSLERIYVDYALLESTSLRAGKFLTPVGRWNLVHAAPLVWTTSRPLTTSNAFPTNATGLMVNGRLAPAGREIEYSVYASNGHELGPNSSIDTFKNALGVHLNAPMLSNTQLGLSYVTFEQERSAGEHKQLIGLDFLWKRDRYEISAEGIYRFSGKDRSLDERGAFVQAVLPLTPQWYAIGRYERYRVTRQVTDLQQYVIGLNYRVTSAIILKAEWVGVRHNRTGVLEGFTASASVFF